VNPCETPDDFCGLDSDLIRIDARVALLPSSHPLATLDIILRSELAGEAIPVWAGHTVDQTAYWTATDLVRHDWRPGPTVSDAAEFGACIRLGETVGFLVRHAAEVAERWRDSVPVPAASG
jgi:DNA-binding transcriptional LysR family regulator